MQLMGRFRRIKLDQTFQSYSLRRRAFRPPNWRPYQTTPEEVSQRENAIKRNKDNARRIETWLLNRISLMGGKKVAMAVGVNESQVTRWKSSWVPKMAMLLAVLEWGVVDDDMARLAKEVASLLKKEMAPKCSQHFEA